MHGEKDTITEHTSSILIVYYFCIQENCKFEDFHIASLTQVVQKFWGFTQAHTIIIADKNKVGKLKSKL